MICNRCGAQNPDNANVCCNCGAAFGQPVYAQPAPMVQPAKGLAVASLVLGILSLFVAAYICGALAIIFGGVAKSKGNRSGMATGGIVLGIIGIVLMIILQVILANTMSFLFSF